jgi:hypothetical protein
MAILTKNLAILFDNGSTATVERDYDDVALTLVTVRCINQTARAVVVSGTVTKNGRSFSTTFPANQTTELPIPQNAANRFDITIDAQGRLDGIDYAIRFA